MPGRTRSDGIEIRVRATPRGGRDAVEGIEALSDGSRVLKVRVRAVPEGGAANEAVRRLLAGAFGVPASAVALTAGGTARLKTFFIEGDAAALAARLAAMTGQDS
ncbi:DUF167 family protein [Microvirga thermotolerans]|uniref:UPF0235 protein GDR74_02470 n=1 Tax=Microvirga thermotolerans TaxID=2651334 RepID=A0A5P9JTS2_9HYPH|nr:DUF167 family protein [Microvirga thermotolerans]QFU15168.1 hypothetical protein GDR74_02470 [Microvirga thermotolerans]